MTSHRVVWKQPRETVLEAFDPPAPAEGQLLLRTRVSLISPGTERAFYLNLPNTSDHYPQYPGYSIVGEVAELGPGVEGWSVGDRAACAAPHASYLVVPASNCLPVPPDLPDEEAAFFNLTAIAMQGIRKMRIELGEPVAVVGAGLIGLLAMRLAQLNGALPVVSVDLDERRREFARANGADFVLPADDSLLPSLRALTDADGASVVVEATGNPEAIPLAFSLARPFGRVVLLGSPCGETERVNFYAEVHRKGITVVGAHVMMCPPRDSSPGWWTREDDQKTALKLMAMKRLDVRPFLTHRFPWHEAPQAYERLGTWDKESLGMLLDWREG